MSSSEASIHVAGLSKRYEIYAQPADRLKQMILPKLRRWAHRSDKAYFQEFWALHGVSFDVRKGETVGIVGRNGSGKSTLLQLICGTLSPTAGMVDVHGRIAALLELGSGFNPEFTGRENVYLNAAVLGLSRVEIDARFDDIVAFADIGEFVEQPVKTYSSGMYIRLAFAVAINVDPEILVVDEALSVGDEAFQRKCFARINTIRDAGATVLFVSHSASTVIDLCDRAVLLDGGEVLALGTPKFVVSRYHKLLYAPAEKAAQVREQIRQDMWQEQANASATCKLGVIANANQGRRARLSERLPDDYLDEGMVPESVVRYSNRGAQIEDAHVESLDGRRVNVLRSGSTYVYTYRVRFERSAMRVRFGMMIKTITGIELGGAASHTQMGAEGDCVAESQATVRFEFRCLLAPGVYFLNAGVLGDVEGREEYLDRYLDIAMFRVLPDPDRLATGTVDFEVASRVNYGSAVML